MKRPDGRWPELTVLFTAAVLAGCGSSNRYPTKAYPNCKLGTPLFTEAGTVAALSDPTSITAGDVDGDGHTDLVVTGSSGNVAVMLARGGTSFDVGTYPVGDGTSPSSAAIGDIDNDGHADLVIGHYMGGAISLLRNSGSSTFGAPTNLNADNNVRSVALVDLDHDGYLDIVAAGANAVTTYINQTSGHFATPRAMAMSAPSTLTLADINGDRQPEIVLLERTGDDAAILINNGGTLSVFGKVTVTGAQTMTVGDFNGDGHADIAATDFSSSLGVFINQSDGTFGSPVALALTGGVTPISMANNDVDGDGTADIVVAAAMTSVLFWQDNDRLGSRIDFPGGDVSMPVGAPAAAFGDFNRSAHKDLAVLIASQGAVRILIDRCQ